MKACYLILVNIFSLYVVLAENTSNEVSDFYKHYGERRRQGMLCDFHYQKCVQNVNDDHKNDLNDCALGIKKNHLCITSEKDIYTKNLDMCTKQHDFCLQTKMVNEMFKI